MLKERELTEPSIYNEVIETPTVVAKPLTRKDADFKRNISNYKNILQDFLNIDVGSIKAEMQFHTLDNVLVWELFKKFSQETEVEFIRIYKKDDLFDFSTIGLKGKNENVVVFYIYPTFYQHLKEHIPNMYLTSEEVEKYTKLFNE